MPALSEIKTEGEFKGLVMSDAGAGKTILGTSFPGKTRVLDFDNKIDSAALYWRHKGQTERLANINVTQFKGNLTGGLATNPINEMLKIFKDEFIPQQKAGKMEFDTLLVDSITTFSSAALRYIVESNPGIKRNMTTQGAQPGLQDYGVLQREFERIINGLLSLPCNVIMLAHIAIEKDETTGAISRHTMMDGSFARKLPIYFKEVWRLYAKDGHRWVQTQTDHMYNCRSQIPGLPNPMQVDNGYADFEKYLKVT